MDLSLFFFFFFFFQMSERSIIMNIYVYVYIWGIEGFLKGGFPLNLFRMEFNFLQFNSDTTFPYS